MADEMIYVITIASVERAGAGGHQGAWWNITDLDGVRRQTEPGGQFNSAVGNPGMREGSHVLIRVQRNRIQGMRPVVFARRVPSAAGDRYVTWRYERKAATSEVFTATSQDELQAMVHDGVSSSARIFLFMYHPVPGDPSYYYIDEAGGWHGLSEPTAGIESAYPEVSRKTVDMALAALPPFTHPGLLLPCTWTDDSALYQMDWEPTARRESAKAYLRERLAGKSQDEANTAISEGGSE